MPTRLSRTARIGAVVAGAVVLVAASPAAATAPSIPPSCAHRVNDTYEKLLECVTDAGATHHLEEFQEIADENGGTRASGTPGYDASLDYVAGLVRDAGYDVTVQEFEFPYFDELSDPVVEQTAPDQTTYVPGEDFLTMIHAGGGDVTAPVSHVDPAADGEVALMLRGSCTLAVKTQLAIDAGAAAVIVYNPEGPLVGGTLSTPGWPVPAVTTTWEMGQDLIDAETAHVVVDSVSETRTTQNLIAETPGGNDENVVMLGAHLDSVPSGPGINDNGSGSAALLEVALDLSKVNVENTVRFVWWGAEELGSVGSYHYVDGLSEQEVEDIALYLNFDMVASPNYMRATFDGDGSTHGSPAPEGSSAIEALYQDFFADRDLAVEEAEITYRSDYAAFTDADIPFGGVYTGSDGVKTPEQAELYGGTAGEPYDPCYHQACDTIDNVNHEVFDLNLDAIAYSALTFAYSTEAVNGVPGQPVPTDAG